jgi:hypothetical protein
VAELMSLQEIEEFFLVPKILEELDEPRPIRKNNNVDKSYSGLCFADGNSIPGTSIDLTFRRGVIATNCSDSYALFRRIGGVPYSVIRIDVEPANSRSHIQDGQSYYGPHLHIGEQHRFEVLDLDLDCRPEHRARWLELLCEHAGVEIRADLSGLDTLQLRGQP